MTESLDITLEIVIKECSLNNGFMLFNANGEKKYILTRKENTFILSPVIKNNTSDEHLTIKESHLMNVDIDMSFPQLLVLYYKSKSLYLQLVIPSSVGLSNEAKTKGITHICTLYKGNNKKNIVPVIPMLFTYQ